MFPGTMRVPRKVPGPRPRWRCEPGPAADGHGKVIAYLSHPFRGGQAAWVDPFKESGTCKCRLPARAEDAPP